MLFNRVIRLGVMGAVVALAALPGAANAATVLYSTYSGAGSWSSAVPSVTEITTLCQSAYTPPGTCVATYPNAGYLGNSTAAVLATQVVASVPLTTSVSLTNTTGSSTPMYSVRGSNKDVYSTVWSTFWPNQLTNSVPYGSNSSQTLWSTNCSTTAGVGVSGNPCVLNGNGATNPVTTISVTLTNPLAALGFIALPADDSRAYTVQVSLFDASSTLLGSLTEGVNGACGNTDIGAASSPCGFFGYTDSIASDPVKSFSVAISCGNASDCDNANGGIGIGDFVFTAAAPEPASMAILGVGLVGLGALRRRRHART